MHNKVWVKELALLGAFTSGVTMEEARRQGNPVCSQSYGGPTGPWKELCPHSSTNFLSARADSSLVGWGIIK
jgi:hypothetical protein